MSDKHQEIIIVKRRGGGHGDDHHGGVWKIAFADFMTAMMAFFLVLWIVNSTSKETRSSVAKYFNPVKLSETTPARKGLNDPKESDFDASAADKPAAADGKESKDKDKSADKAKDKDAKDAKETKDAKAAKDAKDKDKGKEAKDGKDKTSKDGKDGKDKQAGKPDPAPAAARPAKKATGPARLVERVATFEEGALFEDPQAILSDIVATDDGLPLSAGDATPDSAPPARIARGFQDPFEPIAPALGVSQVTEPAPGLRSQTRVATEGPAPKPPAQPVRAPAPAAPQAMEPRNPLEAAAAAPRPEDASKIAAVKPVEGKSGETKGASTDAASAPAKSGDAQRKEETRRDIEKQVRAAVAAQFGASTGPELSVKVVDDGVLVSLTDSLNFEMFAVSSSEPHPRLVKAVGDIASVIQKQPGRVVIRGHTDARPFKNAKSDNWRLSAARAQMAFQMLVRGGFDDRRLERLEGHAATHLRNTADPFAPENRRIELLLQI